MRTCLSTWMGMPHNAFVHFQSPKTHMVLCKCTLLQVSSASFTFHCSPFPFLAATSCTHHRRVVILCASPNYRIGSIEKGQGLRRCRLERTIVCQCLSLYYYGRLSKDTLLTYRGKTAPLTPTRFVAPFFCQLPLLPPHSFLWSCIRFTSVFEWLLQTQPPILLVESCRSFPLSAPVVWIGVCVPIWQFLCGSRCNALAPLLPDCANYNYHRR